MLDAAAWVEGSLLAQALRQSGNLYMLVNAAHILGVGLLIGAIVPLDLRLLGILRHGELPVLAPFLSRAAATGLAVAIATGLALWSVRATQYLGNAAFLWKLAIILLGLMNIGLQHGIGGWAAVTARGEVSRSARLFAALSLAAWLAALVAGRWIGFL